MCAPLESISSAQWALIGLKGCCICLLPHKLAGAELDGRALSGTEQSRFLSMSLHHSLDVSPVAAAYLSTLVGSAVGLSAGFLRLLKDPVLTHHGVSGLSVCLSALFCVFALL